MEKAAVPCPCPSDAYPDCDGAAKDVWKEWKVGDHLERVVQCVDIALGRLL